MTFFVLFFPSIWLCWNPQTLQNKGKRKMPNRPCFTPPTGGPCTWVKPGRFGSFFVLCFLALGERCLQLLCLPGFGTHANTQNLPHFRAFIASIQEHSPPKCLFFMAKVKLPNRPGFALLQGDPGIAIPEPSQEPLFSKGREWGLHPSWLDFGAPIFSPEVPHPDLPFLCGYPERQKLTN